MPNRLHPISRDEIYGASNGRPRHGRKRCGVRPWEQGCRPPQATHGAPACFLVATLPSTHSLLAHHASLLRTTMTGLAALTLTQAWVPASSDVWNGPGWSLSAEAFFYLLFPLAALASARLGRYRLYIALAACWALS